MRDRPVGITDIYFSVVVTTYRYRQRTIDSSFAYHTHTHTLKPIYKRQGYDKMYRFVGVRFLFKRQKN